MWEELLGIEKGEKFRAETAQAGQAFMATGIIQLAKSGRLDLSDLVDAEMKVTKAEDLPGLEPPKKEKKKPAAKKEPPPEESVEESLEKAGLGPEKPPGDPELVPIHPGGVVAEEDMDKPVTGEQAKLIREKFEDVRDNMGKTKAKQVEKMAVLLDALGAKKWTELTQRHYLTVMAWLREWGERG